MNLQEFLSLIVPAGKLVAGKLVDRVNAEGKPYKAFSHAVVGDHAALAAQLLSMDRERLNAYFALASYSQGFHPKPAEPDKKQLRVRTNVVSLKALWFDIDFKPDPKTGVAIYPDIKTALLAVKVFCQTVALAFPSVVVGSGNGVHVYWVFAEPVPLERWQRLADALKAAAFDKGLVIDPTCTADACRVLRPPGTSNWKDPANPKPVKILYASGESFTYEQIETIVTPWIGTVRRSVTPSTSAKAPSVYDELTGGLNLQSSGAPTALFDEVAKKCGVARMLLDTHGKAAPEPLWTASLQLLKFCADGAMWVQSLSDGHPGYDPVATTKKWEQRLANTAGPTLCKTLEGWEPTICAKCPHRGHISTPIELGHAETQTIDVMPNLTWRIAENRKGIERLMIDGDKKEWEKVLRYVVTNVRASRSHATRHYDMSLDFEIDGVELGNIKFPTGEINNLRKLSETLGNLGLTLRPKELQTFSDFMNTWLAKLQANRRVAGGTEQLGWIIDKTEKGDQLVGFAAGPTTFYTDGRVRNDVHTSRDYASIAKLYEPKGGLDQWKQVARFLAEQNKGAFIATLSAAFATPLLRFTGLSGGILSIVSTVSGVGKSSVLKCSQAVWGSPTHGVNAVNDTSMSVAKKLGYLNNLPAYWDELRGRRALDDFLTLAFQVTQGKERTRLDSSANLKEVATWETMLVVASNESIFDAMARHGNGSDAGMMRTFEMTIESFVSERNKAELSMLFETLHGNYGGAGKVYAQYLATNAVDVEKRVKQLFKAFSTKLDMQPQERFWFAIAAVLLAGAEIAKRLELVPFDLQKLGKYVLANIENLRRRSTATMALKGPQETIATFMAQFNDSAVVVDRFPKKTENAMHYMPDLTGGIPRTDRMVYQVSRTESLMRVAQSELVGWLDSKHLPVSSTLSQLRQQFGMRKMMGVLGAGTKWRTIPQQLYEFDLTRFGLQPFTTGVPSSLAGNSGSHAPTAPANSTPGSSPP